MGGATVLALATLGNALRNRNNPICVASPKVAKASTMVTVHATVIGVIVGIIALNFAKVNATLKKA